MTNKILIVDDSKTDQMIIANMLKEFNVLTADDGIEAMRVIDHTPDIDIIILDLNMPNMDGFQVLQILNSDAKYYKLRVIILTNFDEIDNEIKGLKSGAVDYIRKPVNIESLQVRIGIHLELKKIQEKIEQDNRILDSLVSEKTADLIALSEKLQKSELLFRTIFDQAPIGIAIGNNDKYSVSNDDQLPTINPMFQKITGRTDKDLTSMSWADFTHPDDLQADLNNFAKFKSGAINGYSMEKRYLKPDGSDVWVNMIITALKINDNPDYQHLCLIEDISKRKSMEKVLYESERSKSVMLSNLPGMAYRCNYDREWTMQFVSEGCFELTGYKAENLLYNKDLSFNDIIVPEYFDALWSEWEHTLALKIPFRYEYEIMTASGKRKWVLEMGQGIFNEKGGVDALEGIIIDISKQKEREFEIQYLTDHDYLTGLYNRRYFEEFLTRELNDRRKGKNSLLLVNLRNFNLINLTFGYDFGEKLVKNLSTSLSTLSTKNRQLFQISADRFAFYVKEYWNREELTALCAVITNTINASLPLKTIGGSIGVVEIDLCKSDVGNILKYASIAAENADTNQPFGYSFFDTKMETEIMREVDIKDELAKVSSDNNDTNFYLQYQPILDLKTNKIYGFEALARLKSEKLGTISPMEFIPIAEETGLIILLDQRIMRLAFSFLKELELNGYDDIKMSFNISTIQLLRDDFLVDLINCIGELQINSGNLCIEITESLFSDNYQEINRKLEKFKALGIKVSIDDFGTGYSSLARERELQINCLKIDKYFIDKLQVIDPKEAITGDIVSMAHKLGHYVIAEGVETEKQKQYLIENHCDYMQGYLFSKPLSREAALALLKATNKV